MQTSEGEAITHQESNLIQYEDRSAQILSEPARDDGRFGTGVPHGAMLGAKYEVFGSKLLRSSAEMAWQGCVAAEIRRHTDLHCPSFLQPVNEVAIAVAGSAKVNRRANGPEQNFLLRPGAACICPRGVEVNYLHIFSGQLDMLHLYLPMDLYGTLNSTANAPVPALIYCGGIVDPLISQIALAISEEMELGRSTGSLLIDSLGMALAARMLQRYSRQSETSLTATFHDAETSKGLDQVRLDRVLDFINHTVTDNISLEKLADIACLSMYHFSRAFKLSTGSAPYQYICNLRISRCKALLADHTRTIEEIAISAGFSSGANFARTFKKVVGISPSQYRIQRM
ncbi:helix-turn-helix transcriptional regulator (plasmid) [Agrobacterium tumefaciens]|uniref:Helix-turn-helix transcriptional regulator n=1 Tax=Agrobacterium tumefaciens TaxID=358 RepID=A0AAJ4N8Q9_AGRTU|nr:helix-turn-helix transcriptional regulator [Agrobacterium tumefaciens]